MKYRNWKTEEIEAYDLIFPVHFIHIIKLDDEETFNECFKITLGLQGWRGSKEPVPVCLFPIFSMRMLAEEFWNDVVSQSIRDRIAQAERMARFGMIANTSTLENMVLQTMQSGGVQAVAVDIGQKHYSVFTPSLKNVQMTITEDGTETSSFRIDLTKGPEDEAADN